MLWSSAGKPVKRSRICLFSETVGGEWGEQMQDNNQQANVGDGDETDYPHPSADYPKEKQFLFRKVVTTVKIKQGFGKPSPQVSRPW